MRKPQEAIPYLEAAVRLDHSSAAFKATLGEAYLEAGSPEKAVPNLQSVPEEGDTAGRHYQLSRAYRALHMREQSEEELRKYRELTRQTQAQSTLASITPP